mmetsp:Transcript_51293/g.133227  ORF Transcript_51293/g.133227 Transcript_51293/m.133227 type:complete len:365 (+) Transcript_51293:79-1173(+)
MTTKRNRNLPQQLTLDHVSPATRLLEKRRQMFEVQEALDAQKEEFERREATFKRREEMLKKKDLELQESLIRFNKFLQENDSKRNRAEKKRLDEERQKTSKEAEIERLKTEVQVQLAKRADMEYEVKKMSKYQTFLDTVLELEEDYPEITDLLSRYATLDAAHGDLIERQDIAGRENEDARAELTQFVREKGDDILASNNELADLQQMEEREIAVARDLVSEAERQLDVSADSTLQLGQVMMACENIYSRCVAKSKIGRKTPVAENSDETTVLCEKLDIIQEFVTDLAWISKLAKPREASTPKGDATASIGPVSTAKFTASVAEASTGGAGGGSMVRTSMHAGASKAAPPQSRQSVNTSQASDR